MSERMKFFLPDAQDLVDPSFDFDKEERGHDRMRHRSDAYAHELFKRPPYDGMLVSKAIVKSRYTLAQQQRFLRLGVRRFLRIKDGMPVIGDCGAFSYKELPAPPYSVGEVIQFYEQAGFTYGISVDHVILAYDPTWDAGPDVSSASADAHMRRELTLSLARDFLSESKGSNFSPMGVAQGWSPQSYADSVVKLQKMGYTYIAMGGFVPLKTPEILQTLEAVNNVRKHGTKLHLLGVTRLESIFKFAYYGAASFDSTAPLVQAFKSDKDNFHTLDKNYVAIRVPQVDGNAKLKARILAGEVSQGDAMKAERDCMVKMKGYAEQTVSLDEAISSLMKYTILHDEEALLKPAKYELRVKQYRETLSARPWENDGCEICRAIGHHVILFRGAERNRRRGFHNVDVFYRRLMMAADTLVKDI